MSRVVVVAVGLRCSVCARFSCDFSIFFIIFFFYIFNTLLCKKAKNELCNCIPTHMRAGVFVCVYLTLC